MPLYTLIKIRYKMTTRLGKLKDNSGNVLYTQTSANKVVNTPYGDITATDVQTAIQELDTKKQTTLVSATNIKTINGNSLLGSGDLSVSGANIDGSNMTLTALTSTAQQNITDGVFSKIQTTDNTKVGYVFVFSNVSGIQTLPAGGSYLVNSFMVAGAGYPVLSVNNNNKGIFAGGSVVGQAGYINVGIAIKIQ